MVGATLTAEIDSRGAVRGRRQFDDSADGIVNAGRRIDRSIAGTVGGINTIGAAASQATRLIGGLAIGLGGLRVGSAIGELNAGFDDTLARLQGITNATESEIQALEEQARRIGQAPLATANQAAEGLVFLAQTGFDVTEQLESIGPALEIAAAGNIELARSADIASNVLSIFGREVEELASIGDVLIGVTQNSNTNFEQLAQALIFAGPPAASLGVDLNELAAAIGILGDSGLQATLAGTGLRQTLLSLVSPTSSGVETFRELGISLDEVDLQGETLVDVFERLSEANITAAQAAAIFSNRAVGVVTTLAESSAEFRALTQETENFGGSAGRVAELRAESLRGTFTELQSAVQELGLAVGREGGLNSNLTFLVNIATDVTLELANAREDLSLWPDVADAAAAATRALTGALAGAGLAGALGLASRAYAGFLPFLTGNPFLVAGAAAGVATAGIVTLAVELDQASEQAAKNRERLDALADSNRELADTYDDLIESQRIFNALGEEAESLESVFGEFAQNEQIRNAEEQARLLGDAYERLAFEATTVRDRTVDLLDIPAGPFRDSLVDALRTVQEVDDDILRLQTNQFDRSIEALQRRAAQGFDVGDALDQALAAQPIVEQLGQVDASISDLAQAFLILQQQALETGDEIRESLSRSEIDTEDEVREVERLGESFQALSDNIFGSDRIDTSALNDVLAGLRDEAELAGLAADERDRLTALREVAQAAVSDNLGIRDTINALGQASDLLDRIEDAASNQERAERIDDASDSLISYLGDLEQEVELAAASADERERILAAQRFLSDLDSIGIQVGEIDVDAALAAIDQLVVARQELDAQNERETALQERGGAIERSLAPLREQIELLQVEEDERRVLLATKRAEDAARASGVPLLQQERDEIRRLVEQLTELERAEALGSSLARAFTDAGRQIVAQFDDIEGAFETLIQRLQAIVLDALIFDPIEQQLSSFISDLLLDLGSAGGDGGGGIGGGGGSGAGGIAASLAGGAADAGTAASDFGNSGATGNSGADFGAQSLQIDRSFEDDSGSPFTNTIDPIEVPSFDPPSGTSQFGVEQQGGQADGGTTIINNNQRTTLTAPLATASPRATAAIARELERNGINA